MLLATPTLEEVRASLLSIPSDSAPGCDGFTLCFFLTSWEIIKEDLYGATKEFFNGAPLPQSYMTSFITLIPKVEKPEGLNDYRPISLCFVVYKIFTKIIASRLSSILPKLISGNQGAYVSGKDISETITLAQEMVGEHGKKTRGSNVMIKIDMSKAYDRMDWKFLRAVVLRFGFCKRWVALIA
ncbi:hypothetical protein GIB67_028409 [Kingdonia uniflora]|uniref:Reverse transcriptase domain-containing protein n=1 Tax=Kingdonia uniflora TaxID=39325 RepID=A0A7J7MI24_9MAGN|nr:hypothetical protein GIB67_028409 [Kingdonia uniflora]